MITAVVTTFERPHLCRRLLDSVRQHQPDLEVLVVDDSAEPVAWDGVDTLMMPFDCGLSMKRNAAVQLVGTGWVVMLDDDFVLTPSSRIGRLVDLAEQTGLDVLAGQLMENGSPLDYYGWFDQDGDHVSVRRGWTQQGPVRRCHLIPNFFVARAETLAEHPWDESLKLAEHSVFFWEYRNRLKVGWTDEVSADHVQEMSDSYSEWRSRVHGFKQDWLDRRQLTWTDMSGGTMRPSPDSSGRHG